MGWSHEGGPEGEGHVGDDAPRGPARATVTIDAVETDDATPGLPGLIASGDLPPAWSRAGSGAGPVVWPGRSVRSGAAVSPGHRLARRLVADVVRGALVIAVLNLFVLQISVVRGHSMEPSLLDGDRLVVDRLAYAMSGVDRFDVVVLRYPRDPATDFVKRVVALPGERVSISGGTVFVNGDALCEAFAHVCDHADMREIMVPDDHYFVLGDNRPISCDSREFGLVEGTLLRGKVRARFWPPARFGTL